VHRWLLCKFVARRPSALRCSSVSYFFGEIFDQLFRISRLNFQNHAPVWLPGYLKSSRSPFSLLPVAISAREHARTSGIGLYSFAIYIRTRVRKLSRRSSRLLDRDLARPHGGLFWCRSAALVQLLRDQVLDGNGQKLGLPALGPSDNKQWWFSRGCSKSEADREADIVPVISESRGWPPSVALIASCYSIKCRFSPDIASRSLSIQNRNAQNSRISFALIGARSAGDTIECLS